HSHADTGTFPQPDYLRSAPVLGGWSKLNIPTVVVQVEVILRLIQFGRKTRAGDTARDTLVC
ncbi:hypothetical protein DFH07DRAFT_742867, partial [Mycena maculata]